MSEVNEWRGDIEGGFLAKYWIWFSRGHLRKASFNWAFTWKPCSRPLYRYV